MKLITNRKLEALQHRMFLEGFVRGNQVGNANGRKVGTILAGYDAVKEAEKILREGK